MVTKERGMRKRKNEKEVLPVYGFKTVDAVTKTGLKTDIKKSVLISIEHPKASLIAHPLGRITTKDVTKFKKDVAEIGHDIKIDESFAKPTTLKARKKREPIKRKAPETFGEQIGTTQSLKQQSAEIE